MVPIDTFTHKQLTCGNAHRHIYTQAAHLWLLWCCVTDAVRGHCTVCTCLVE